VPKTLDKITTAFSKKAVPKTLDKITTVFSKKAVPKTLDKITTAFSKKWYQKHWIYNSPLLFQKKKFN
jgi:hypothetical protein